MKKISNNKLENNEPENYRNLVSGIHYKFQELQNMLSTNQLKESIFYLDVAYKSFTDKVLQDLQKQNYY